ncbi:hypothetical protein [Allomesorhizobium camelthorni]|uniref:hypothetical protein n=1 Tax=Allomesorhizobium camelthorni TaxID=475069 RepID=UPI0031B59C72
MPQIGTFTRQEDGFFDNIRALSLDAKLVILPARGAGIGNAPGASSVTPPKSARRGIAPGRRRASMGCHR